MKKLLKKVLTLSLCVSMMAVMATSASAATSSPKMPYNPGTFYKWTPASSSGNIVMNINGNETVVNASVVNMYTDVGMDSQRFSINFSAVDGLPRVYSKLLHSFSGDGRSNGFTLNIFRDNNKCLMWRVTPSNPNATDSVIDYITSSGKLKMQSGSRVLTAGAQSGEYCAWIQDTNISNQVWNFN